ncbi:MAG: hypothetical protein ACRENO_01385 [Thermodesulfobacteriota bacterium]
MSKPKKEVCMICGKASKDIICENCKAKVRGDAVGEKKQMEKGVNVGGDVLADRKIGHKN